MTAIRKPAVAGSFYPGESSALGSAVELYLENAKIGDGPPPKAIIAPHAGFVYSGPVAATAYARLKPVAERIKRVVLLGPCHRVAVRGLALSGADSFLTPLGEIPIDKEAAAMISDLSQVGVFDPTHELEHSLEVHLPFLQVLLGDFKLLPLVVGETPPGPVAEVLDILWGGPETLIVVSSDLSHYLDYQSARKIDAETCRAIENLDPSGISRDGACGRFPVGGLLETAKRRGMTVETVDLRNSGDTAGSKDRVVGYGSWLFFEPVSEVAEEIPAEVEVEIVEPVEPVAPADLPAVVGEDDFGAATANLLNKHGTTLVLVAAASIDHGLTHGQALPITLDGHAHELRKIGACFVTLKKAGALRGCIGSPEAYRPLIVDVAENAYRAAFGDPRFPNLGGEERDGLYLSVSVLSPQTPMSISGEDDLLAQLRPGRDGLVIADGARRALFLPSVWEQLAQPSEFLGRLKLKAGLTADHWSDDFKAWRFVTEEISVDDLTEPNLDLG